MALFRFTDLITPLTRAEVRTSIYASMTKLGLRVTAWEAGAVTRTIVTACSSMFAALSELQAEIARSGFLEYARGPWLRIVAKYVYNVDAYEATFATGEVRLTNTGGGLYNVEAGDCIVRNAGTGKAYRNAVAFDLGAGSSVSVTFVALEAGTDSNANAGAITEFVTTLNRVEVTNARPLIGQDAEKDPELRARCREKLGALSPLGPWDAYSFAARNTKLSSGAPAGVTRTAITRDGYGNLYLRVGSASGGVSAPALDAIDEAVQRTAAPLSVTAHVLSADALLVPVNYHAWIYNTSGLTNDEVKAAVAKALITLSTEQPIGGQKLVSDETNGYVFTDAIRAAIGAALPEIYHVVLTSPAGDTPVTPAQIPVFIHDPETQATITQVARPLGSAY
jgi:phage-related baseplate assembly protein